MDYIAEYNKLIKTVGHRPRLFSNNDYEQTFVNNFDCIWIISYSHFFTPSP